MKFIHQLKRMVAIVTLGISTTAVAESDVVISIDEGVSMAQPIAVVPFKGVANVSSEVAQIISDDLRNSGKFSPVPLSQMREQPGSVAEVN
mgnify:FL=1